jgi:hypothetical protein
MTWFIVLVVVGVVSGTVVWIKHRKGQGDSEPHARKPLDVRDVQATRDSQDLMRSVRDDWRR